MQYFDELRLYEIDLSDSQLSQEDMERYLERLRSEKEREAAKEKARWAQAGNFRFKGGML